jgi:hypothetical protein
VLADFKIVLVLRIEEITDLLITAKQLKSALVPYSKKKLNSLYLKERNFNSVTEILPRLLGYPIEQSGTSERNDSLIESFFQSYA